jgi:hypothetical protein
MKLATRVEVATMTGRNPATVTRWIQDGKLQLAPGEQAVDLDHAANRAFIKAVRRQNREAPARPRARQPAVHADTVAAHGGQAGAKRERARQRYRLARLWLREEGAAVVPVDDVEALQRAVALAVEAGLRALLDGFNFTAGETTRTLEARLRAELVRVVQDSRAAGLAAVDAVEPEPELDLPADPGSSCPLDEISALADAVEAHRFFIKHQRQDGRLVERTEAAKRMAKLAADVASRVLTLPAAVAPKVAALLSSKGEAQAREVIAEEIDRAVRALRRKL